MPAIATASLNDGPRDTSLSVEGLPRIAAPRRMIAGRFHDLHRCSGDVPTIRKGHRHVV